MEWLGRFLESTPVLKNILVWFLGNVVKVGPMPGHIAFIMDGNRRYARQHNKKIVAGHREGGIKLKEVHFSTSSLFPVFLEVCTLTRQMLDNCNAMGIHTVTAFAFSLDNFKRSQQEVRCLIWKRWFTMLG